MSCEDCKKENKDKLLLAAHEADMYRMERMEQANKRLWIVVIVLIGVLLVTNCAWLWYESQFEDVVTTIEADAEDGGNAFANNGGDINYGES